MMHSVITYERSPKGYPCRMDREPVIILAVVQAFLGLVIAFGFDMDGEQVAAIMAVSAAILGFVARKKVTPTGEG